MATTTQPTYGVPVSLPCTLVGLASDTNLLAGRQSGQIDNSGSVSIDVLLGGTIATTGTPIAAKAIEIWVWGSWDAGGHRTAGAGAVDANLTLPTVGVKQLMAQALIIATDAVVRTYSFGPISVAKLFGGTMPSRWGVFVVHNTGTPLGAAALAFTPVQYVNA